IEQADEDTPVALWHQASDVVGETGAVGGEPPPVTAPYDYAVRAAQPYTPVGPALDHNASCRPLELHQGGLVLHAVRKAGQCCRPGVPDQEGTPAVGKASRRIQVVALEGDDRHRQTGEPPACNLAGAGTAVLEHHGPIAGGAALMRGGVPGVE